MRVKLLLLSVVLCLASVCASAQWKVASVGSGEPNTKLLQVINTENSTLVYATISMNCTDNHIVSINRGACVKAGGMKYKILNSVNIPLKDDGEPRYACFRSGLNEVNFVMEFEKFPVEDGFDIIENQNEGDLNFNFHDVTVTSIDESKVLDTKRFLDSAAPVIEGLYAKNGIFFLYYIRDGVCITCNAVAQDGGWATEDEVFYVDIVNDSDHGIMFDFDKVSIVGNRKKSNGDVDSKAWTKYTPESYEAFVQQLDYDEARYKTFGPLNLISDKLNWDTTTKTEYGSWERIGMKALGDLTNQAIENRINDYMQEHPKEHPSALRSESIKAGDAIHGYIASKKKKADEAEITIPMDGYNFTFSFDLK